MISLKETSSLLSFGISIPIAVVPGIFSTTRKLVTDIVLAKSFERSTICFTFMPFAGIISNKVTTGPGFMPCTSISILKSLRLLLRRSDISCKELSSYDDSSFGC